MEVTNDNNNCTESSQPNYHGVIIIDGESMEINKPKRMDFDAFFMDISNEKRDEAKSIIDKYRHLITQLAYDLEIKAKNLEIWIVIEDEQPVEPFIDLFYSLVNILYETHNIKVNLLDYFYLNFRSRTGNVHTNYRLLHSHFMKTRKVRNYHFYSVFNDFGRHCEEDISDVIRQFHPQIKEIYSLFTLDGWLFEEMVDDYIKNEKVLVSRMPSIFIMPYSVLGDPYRLDVRDSEIVTSVPPGCKIYPIDIWYQSYLSYGFGSKIRIGGRTFILRVGSVYLGFSAGTWKDWI